MQISSYFIGYAEVNVSIILEKYVFWVNFFVSVAFFRDKRDGMSRAGSGRVAVLSLTGIIKSYTLECNYNTGRIVNVLPPTIREPSGKVHTLPVPPKYNPQVFEEVIHIFSKTFVGII